VPGKHTFYYEKYARNNRAKRLLKYFLSYLYTDNPSHKLNPYYTALQGAEVLKVILAAKESAATGKVVNL
jgi:hypothetical protein